MAAPPSVLPSTARALCVGALLSGLPALALALLSQAQRAPVWTLVGAAAVGGALVAAGARALVRSRIAVHEAQAQAERARLETQLAQLKEAIRSQALVDGGELARLDEALQGAARRQHGLSNAVMSASLNMDMLLTTLRGREVVAAETLDLAEQVREGIARLRRMAVELKQAAQVEPAGEAQPVGVEELLARCLAQAQRRHPHTRFVRDAAPQAPERVRMRGGAGALEGLMSGLLDNAAQGDGAKGAAQVVVRATFDTSGQRLLLEIVDDGPGLPAALAGAPEPFRTTKQGALGLGLFVCDRLVRASRGQLHVENAPAGGALARVLLPLDVPPPESAEAA